MATSIRFSALDDDTHSGLVHLEKQYIGKEVSVTIEMVGRSIETIVGIFQGIEGHRVYLDSQQLPFFGRTMFIKNIVADGKTVYENNEDGYVEKSLGGSFYVFQANKMASRRAGGAFSYIEKQ